MLIINKIELTQLNLNPELEMLKIKRSEVQRIMSTVKKEARE
jgi:hypothetical protein